MVDCKTLLYCNCSCDGQLYMYQPYLEMPVIYSMVYHVMVNYTNYICSVSNQ